MGPFAAGVLHWGEDAAISSPNATMVVSRTLQRYFRQQYDRETIYVPNGAALVSHRLPRQLIEWDLQSENYVLFLGRFSPEKNCDLLIRAFETLRTSMKLVLAGGSSHSDAYVKGLRRHESDSVRFLPWVSGTHLEELLSNAALLSCRQTWKVCPSLFSMPWRLVSVCWPATFPKITKWSRAPASPSATAIRKTWRSCSTCSFKILYSAARPRVENASASRANIFGLKWRALLKKPITTYWAGARASTPNQLKRRIEKMTRFLISLAVLTQALPAFAQLSDSQIRRAIENGNKAGRHPNGLTLNDVQTSVGSGSV